MEILGTQINLIEQFLHIGGTALRIILLISICLWFLIIERMLYFKLSYPLLCRRWLQYWRQRQDKKSRHAHHIRLCIISEARISMNRHVSLIKMLIGICPLLGLLGTVSGMIHVFDVMTVTGSGNARAMADGVSQATIPTMAGMVIAIAGLYFSKIIEERVSYETHQLSDLLQFH